MASPDQEVMSPSALTAQSPQHGISDAAAEPAITENSVEQPFPTSEQSPVDDLRDTIQSPTQSALHPLPAKPLNQPPSQVPTPIMSSTPVPSQPQRQPRIVGGFEVDDDPDEEDVAQDEKDDADVYDPSIGVDFDAPTPAPANALDRTSQSPEQENGITPAPVQATGSLADISSSTLLTGGDATRAATATPAQTAPATPAQPSPPRSHVNGLVNAGLPKSRLAHDVIGILEDRIKDDPRGDTAAYLELIDELKSRNKQDDVRRVYEQYLTVFPFDVRIIC